MTSEELAFLNQEARDSKQSLFSYLMRGISQRHPADALLRCVRCGVCMPSKRGRSIYSEFCEYCQKKLEEGKCEYESFCR